MEEEEEEEEREGRWGLVSGEEAREEEKKSTEGKTSNSMGVGEEEYLLSSD